MHNVVGRYKRFVDTSANSRRLLRLLQQINFGKLTCSVFSGELDFQHAWTTRKTLKLASDQNGPRPETSLSDFELSHEQIALIETLQQVMDGAEVTIEVRGGIPFVLEVCERHEVKS